MLWFKCGYKFYFPLFLDMVMYDNEFEKMTKKKKINKLRIKLNHTISCTSN